MSLSFRCSTSNSDRDSSHHSLWVWCRCQPWSSAFFFALLQIGWCSAFPTGMHERILLRTVKKSGVWRAPRKSLWLCNLERERVWFRIRQQLVPSSSPCPTILNTAPSPATILSPSFPELPSLMRRAVAKLLPALFGICPSVDLNQSVTPVFLGLTPSSSPRLFYKPLHMHRETARTRHEMRSSTDDAIR